MNKTIVKSSRIDPLCKYHQIGVDWAKSVIALTFADALYSVTAEEGPRGRNVLLLTSMPHELLTILPHFKSDDVVMNLYNIIDRRVFM